jgi:hypothetical protein
VNVDVDPSKSSELRAAIPVLRAKQALLLSVNFGCSTQYTAHPQLQASTLINSKSGARFFLSGASQHFRAIHVCT